MKIPGIAIHHALITPNCRTVERPGLGSDPRMGAFEEAVVRCRAAYRAHIEKCAPELLAVQDIHVAVTVDKRSPPKQEEGVS